MVESLIVQSNERIPSVSLDALVEYGIATTVVSFSERYKPIFEISLLKSFPYKGFCSYKRTWGSSCESNINPCPLVFPVTEETSTSIIESSPRIDPVYVYALLP